MRILPDLPDLHILPTSSLHPHEHHDERRASPLAQALEREGVLRNPPIVARLGSRDERYVVLDGANRTTACRQIGLEYVLAQVVQPGENQVQVETWNHVLLGVDSAELLGWLERPGAGVALRAADSGRAHADLAQGGALALVSLADGRWLSLEAPASDLRSRVGGLNRIVDVYRDRARIERTNAGQLSELTDAFPDGTALLVFRGFEVGEVVEAVAQGLLLPGGLTRFIVSPRALRVNYPLSALRGAHDRAAKEAVLRAWLEGQLAARRVRYYAEATYLFDE